MKKPSLFLVFIVSLAVCACDNPMMADLLQPKTITFDSNGGSHVPSQTVLNNKKISPPRDPFKAGYLFNGWYTDNYFFGNRWNFNDVPKGDMTLYAGWREEKQIPAAGDFYIEGVGTFVYDGSPKTVTVTPKPGKTGGNITVYYQRTDGNMPGGKDTTPPINPGTYLVTFDVEAFEGWNAAYELEAGMLSIIEAIPDNKTPVANDYNITNLTQFLPNPGVDSISAVNITPKEDKSQGTVTIYYEGTNGTTYEKSTSKPSNIGSYAVTFDVAASAASPNWNAATGIKAGTLEINVFKTIESLGTWLAGQTGTTTTVAYPVALNVSSLGGSSDTSGSAGAVLRANDTKRVNLDLSGSTFTSIENLAFLSCFSLTGITIPDSVTSIRSGAFYDCTSLTSVTIPNSVKSIGDHAFCDCTGLTSVTIGNGVTSIEWGAFDSCTGLTGITIPASVISIGNSAFEYCTNLTSVRFERAGTTLDLAAFINDESLRSAYSGGGIGTYTRSGDGTAAYPYVWTKVDY